MSSELADPTSASRDAGPKDRLTYTVDQRRALRRWVHSQTPRPTHKACIEWFQAQYGQTMSQATVSHSLSSKYACLDDHPQPAALRVRTGNWHDVEKLVLPWYQQTVNEGRQPSNRELSAKAKAISPSCRATRTRRRPRSRGAGYNASRSTTA